MAIDLTESEWKRFLPLLWYADFPAFLWRKTCDRRSANEPFHHNMKERYTKYFFAIGT